MAVIGAAVDSETKRVFDAIARSRMAWDVVWLFMPRP